MNLITFIEEILRFTQNSAETLRFHKINTPENR